MQIDSAPLILGVHYLSFYGFGSALLLGLWLVHRTMYGQRGRHESTKKDTKINMDGSWIACDDQEESG